MRLLTTGFLLIISLLAVQAQPQLEIYPSRLEYPDIFHRLQNAYLINTGDQTLRIDSIYYSNNDFYYVRFNVNWRFPIFIAPGDSIGMDCILAGYINYVYSNTRDTIFVYNNSSNPYAQLEIRIDYYENESYSGILQGNISSGGNPVADADIYFLYGGNFIIARTTSDLSGNYSIELPVGSYTVAAQKDSFYTSFYNQQTDPLSSTQVVVDTNGISNADLALTRRTPTLNSISGMIYDSTIAYPLKKGIVVVRSGTHTPGKLQPGKTDSLFADNTYTAFVNPDGTYEVDDIQNAGYYYVQAFSDYFVPSYYDSLGNYPSFWQNADSVYIGTSVINSDIYLPRDSSVGGGIISGVVQLTSNRDSAVSDAIIYARSAENNIFTYAFSQTDGRFRENFLPYGSYYLVAQKIGYEDAVSDKIIIDSTMTSVGDVLLQFSSPNSVADDYFKPNGIRLYQNYPNPFNPSTTIEFVIPSASVVKIQVTDILGRTVSLIQNGYLAGGNYKFLFDGKNLASGIYFVNLTTGNISITKKILLLK